MSGQVGGAAACPGVAGRDLQPIQKPRAANPSFALAVAVSALAAGIGLVGAGLTLAQPHGSGEAVSWGAQLYAAECAACHGARLEARTQLEDAHDLPWAPSLGAAGHAWRHSDAELAAIVAQGVRGGAPPGSAVGMPAFAGRLDRGEIDAILAYAKSGWPGNLRAYQAALARDGGETLIARLRDPAWVFPGQCPSPPAAADSR